VARTVLCSKCNGAFTATHSQAKYCSPNCARLGARESWKRYGDRNKEKRLAYHRELYERDPEARAAQCKDYRSTPAGKQAVQITGIRQRHRFPEKYKARQAVLIAVRAGRMEKLPCQVCGDPAAEAHHPDYSRPLDVVWLCAPHHRAEHRRMRRAQPESQAA